MRDSSLADSQEHRVARGGRVHGVGLGTLRAYSDSVALGPLSVATISKSPQVALEFQGPAVTLKIGAATHEIVMLSDSSMTDGGVVGNVGAAVSMMLSVILDLSAVRIRLFRPRRRRRATVSAVGTGVGPPSWRACAVLTSFSYSHLLPSQAGSARFWQGPPEAAPRKLRVRCYLTRRVVTDTRARASKLGRCAIRICELRAPCTRGVQHQARTAQRHVFSV